MANKDTSVNPLKTLWRWFVVYPMRFFAMGMALIMFVGLFFLWRLPDVARENNVELKDVLLRSIASHRFEPFYVLKQESEIFKSAELPWEEGTIVTRKLGPNEYEHKVEGTTLPPTITVTPHTRIPAWELKLARKELEAIFPPKENPEQWAEAVAWGKGLFQIWWFNQIAKAAAAPGEEEAKEGTEDEYVWFAWRRLWSDDRRRRFQFPHLIERARKKYPDEQQYQSAITWAKNLHGRLKKLPEVTQHSQMPDVELPKTFFVKQTVPPACEWTWCWMLDQYLGLTERTEKIANERWFSYFLPRRKAEVIRFAHQLEQERRTDGEVMPPTSENLRLFCVVERYVGTDPYGIRCRELVSETIAEANAFGTQNVLLYGAYPNDEIYFVASSRDRFQLFPAGRNIVTRMTIRIVFLLWLAWGARSVLNSIVAERILGLRENPLYQRYRKRRKKTSSRVGLLLGYLLIPGITWVLAWVDLPLYLQLIVEPWELLIEVYLSVWFGGTILLLINQFVALCLMRYHIDPEKSWLDEVISLPVAIYLLYHFGNGWISIAGFVGLSLIPELIIRLRGDREKPMEAELIPEGGERRRSLGRRILVYTGYGFLTLIGLAIIGSLLPDDEPEKQKEAVGTITAHDGPVRDLVSFNDSQSLLTAGADGVIRVWRFGEFKTPVAEMRAHLAGVNALAVHEGKKLMASGGAAGTIKIWNVGTYQEMLGLDGHKEAVTSLAFTPDGKRLISGSADHNVKIWDLDIATDMVTLNGHTDEVTGVAVHPNGRLLASSSRDDTVRLWDLQTQKVLATFDQHLSDALDVAFSPKGDVLASAGSDEVIFLWDVPSRKQLRMLEGHEGPVTSLAYRSDGKELLSGSLDGSARLWDVASGKYLSRVKPEGQGVSAVAFFSIFAAVAYERNNVIVWGLISPEK